MEEISTLEAQNVLHHFGYGGTKPTAFMSALIGALAGADANNGFRLALAFPGLSQAVCLITRETYGLAELQRLAALESA